MSKRPAGMLTAAFDVDDVDAVVVVAGDTDVDGTGSDIVVSETDVVAVGCSTTTGVADLGDARAVPVSLGELNSSTDAERVPSAGGLLNESEFFGRFVIHCSFYFAYSRGYGSFLHSPP